MQFTVGTEALNVSSLGRLYLPGNSQTHIVKLVNAQTGVDVPGATTQVTMTSATANTYEYGALPTPIQLTAGGSYLMVSQEFSGGDSWYDYTPVTSTADASVNGPVYQNVSGSYDLVATGPPTNWSYVTVNFQYTVGSPFTLSGSGSSLRNNYSGFVGMKFTVGDQPLTLNALGRMFIAGNTGTHTVKLVNASTGQDVAGGSTQVTMAGGTPYTFTYGTLPSPLNLPPNGSYYLVSQETSGGDQWYDYGPLTVTGAATVSAAVYGSGTTYNQVSGANFGYGPVSFLYGGSSPLVTAQVPGVVRNNFNGGVGMRFQVGAATVTVSQLGRYCAGGNSLTHTIKLVQSNGTDLPGASVSVSMAGCTGGQYVYGLLPSPAVLQANGTYRLVSVEAGGGDQWYDPGQITTSPAVSVLGPTYQLGSSYVDFNIPGATYVPVNLRYEATTALPPSVTITSPSSNSTITGTVSLTAKATVASGLSVASVQFFGNGRSLGAVAGNSTGTYVLQANTATLTSGTVELSAIVTDSAGNVAASPVVPVNLNGNSVVVTTPPVTLSGQSLVTLQHFGALRNNFSGFVGMQFTVGSSSLSLSGVGRMCIAGNSGTHTLQILTGSGTTVTGTSVSVSMSGCTAGNYTYVAFASPVTLSANTAYSLVSQETSGGDQWYDYGQVITTSAVSVNGPLYLQGSSQVLEPLPGNSYVPVNFFYTVATTTPVPPPPTPTPTPSSGSTSVVITSPAPNSVLSGVVTVSALATPATGLTITSVQFQRTNSNIGLPVTGAGPNYSVTLDTRPLQNGQYSLSAVATDSSGNSTFGPSEGVMIVNNITPPTVTVTSPQSGSTGAGLITVSATAVPASGTSVATLQLLIDGQAFGTTCTTTSCSAALDTTLLPNGTHQLTAAAVDSDGGHAISPVVAITANNTVTGIGVLNGFLPGTARTYNNWIGMQFTTGCTALSVNALGRIYVPGNTGTHVVKLVVASTGADVPGGSTTVSFNGAIANRIMYAPLAAPVTLAANTAYYLVSQETTGGDQFYDYEPVLSNGAVTINGPAYLTFGTWATPANPNYMYEPVDFKFTVPGVSFPSAVNVAAASPAQNFVTAVTPATYNHLLVTGQSLSVGATGGPPLSTTQPYANLMLNSGYTALVPLLEMNLETPASSMGNTVTRLSGQSFNDVVTDAGVIGYSYAQLEKGTAPYANAISQLTAANNLAKAAGKSYKIAGVSVIHGETDDSLGTTAAAYAADLVQWQSNYQSDGRAITGQSDPIPFFIDQENSWTYFDLATTTVALGQLSAAESNPGSIFMVGPKYQYHYNDGVHLDNFGYREQGEQFGKVIKETLLNGTAPKPFAPKSVTRSGNIVTVQFNVPAPPLQFDTSTVLPKSAMGFEYTDGSSCSPFIVSAQITAGDTVTLTLSAVPFGTNEHVRYAFTGIPASPAGRDEPGSPRGNLKDSDSTASAYGNDLSNWALTFDKTVSVVTAGVVTPAKTAQ